MYIFALGQGNSGIIRIRRDEAMLYQQIGEKLDEKRDWALREQLGIPNTKHAKVLT